MFLNTTHFTILQCLKTLYSSLIWSKLEFGSVITQPWKYISLIDCPKLLAQIGFSIIPHYTRNWDLFINPSYKKTNSALSFFLRPLFLANEIFTELDLFSISWSFYKFNDFWVMKKLQNLNVCRFNFILNTIFYKLLSYRINYQFLLLRFWAK